MDICYDASTMKKFLLCLIALSPLVANPMQNHQLSMMPSQEESLEIIIQNRPLAKIHGKTISVMDVKKRMDRFLIEHNKEAFEHPGSLFQFYVHSWKQTLQDLINNELMLMEAEELKFNIADGDVHQEMERTYAPNLIEKIEELGLSYADAKQLTYENIVVQSLSWYKIWSQAFQKVTPELLRGAYLGYISTLPNGDKWTYRTLTIRGSDEAACETLATKIKTQMTGDAPMELEAIVEANKENLPEGVTLSISSDLSLTSHELSQAHLSILKSLAVDAVSAAIPQKTKAGKVSAYKFFHLKDFAESTIPTYESMEQELKGKLINQEASTLSETYFSKLRRKYCCEDLVVEKMFDTQYQPFRLK